MTAHTLMTDDQARGILSQVEELLNDEKAASRLNYDAHVRLETIREFLRSWIALGPELSDEQKADGMANLLVTLKESLRWPQKRETH